MVSVSDFEDDKGNFICPFCEAQISSRRKSTTDYVIQAEEHYSKCYNNAVRVGHKEGAGGDGMTAPKKTILERAEELITRGKQYRAEGRTELVIPQAAYEVLEGRLKLVGEFEAILPDLLAEARRLEARLNQLQEHHFIDATPDGGYAMRILQSYRDCFNVVVSDCIGAEPTNLLCIAMNEVNEKRKIEIDKAIKDLSDAAKWRQTAIEERAKVLKLLEAERRGGANLLIQKIAVTVEGDLFRERAARELEIEIEKLLPTDFHQCWECEKYCSHGEECSREWVELPPEGRAALQDAMEFLVYAEIRNEGVNPGNHKTATNALDTIRGMLE